MVALLLPLNENPARTEGIQITLYKRTRDLIHTHQNSYPYFITAIKHGYICFIS